MRKIKINKKLSSWLKPIILLVTLLLIFVTTFYINRQYIASNTDMEVVAVLNKKIVPYSEITKNDVKLQKRVNSEIPQDAVKDIEEFFSEGKSYYTNDLGFGEGDILRQARLTDDKSSPFGEAVKLTNTGKMFFSVNTDLVRTTSNYVKAGVIINAVVFIPGQYMDEPDRVITHKEDPKLARLAVIDKKNQEGTAPAEQGREAIPHVVTFETDNIDVAATLIRYNETGKIYLLPIGVDAKSYFLQEQLAMN